MKNLRKSENFENLKKCKNFENLQKFKNCQNLKKMKNLKKCKNFKKQCLQKLSMRKVMGMIGHALFWLSKKINIIKDNELVTKY